MYKFKLILKEGMDAASKGISLLDCPYSPDSEESRAWMLGYRKSMGRAVRLRTH